LDDPAAFQAAVQTAFPAAFPDAGEADYEERRRADEVGGACDAAADAGPGVDASALLERK